jgi:hypothetical protein
VRRRSRLSLGPAPRQVPLSALVSLAWGPRAVTALPPAERYRRIVQQSVTQPPADAARHLALTHLPMWEVRRPRTWRHLDWSLEQIVQIGSAGGDEGLLEEQLRVGTGVR